MNLTGAKSCAVTGRYGTDQDNYGGDIQGEENHKLAQPEATHMDKRNMSRISRPSTQYFVEVVAPDGLKHHVGPFKQLARAKDWIAQNERTEATQPTHKQSA